MENYFLYDIIPDVIDQPPPAILKVEWSSGAKCMLGNELTPTQVQTQPSVLSWDAEEGALHALVFLVPSHHRERAYYEMVHWMVFNIPGNDVSKGLVNAEYLESGPRKGKGLHRYLYLVFKQPNGVVIEPKQQYRTFSIARRKPFFTRRFSDEYGLGRPIAGNFYRSQWDEYVPCFQYKLFGGADRGLDQYYKYEIVPDVVDEPPPCIMRIEWSNGTKCMLGNELTPTQVKTQPAVFGWTAEEGALYTIVFLVPDLPSWTAPNMIQCLHWLVFNVPDNDVTKGLVNAMYIESGPPDGSAVHRYVYLVYQQPSNRPITPKLPHDAFRPRSWERRKPWNLRRFTEEYGLGKPVAGNFYVSQYDNYVPELEASMIGGTGH